MRSLVIAITLETVAGQISAQTPTGTVIIYPDCGFVAQQREHGCPGAEIRFRDVSDVEGFLFGH